MMIVTIVALYALVGQQMLDTDEKVTEESDFSTFFKANRSMYFLTSMTNYPAILKPYFEDTPLYAFYFLPMVMLCILIILPIPTAVVFEKFRQNRTKVLKQDRLKEKETLFISFICVDHMRRGYIDLKQWMTLISTIYNGTNDEGKTKKAFESIDEKNIGYLDPQQYFEACEILFWMKDLTNSTFKFEYWKKLENFI